MDLCFSSQESQELTAVIEEEPATEEMLPTKARKSLKASPIKRRGKLAVEEEAKNPFSLPDFAKARLDKGLG